MNRAIAKVYAISIANKTSDAAKLRMAELIPELIAEINRLEKIANDPFVRGYIEARKSWCEALSPASGGV